MASETKDDAPGTAYTGFDHVHWWVGNAKQTADWYTSRMGFKRVAYRGLETGSRDVVTHVVVQGTIRFAFSSQLNVGATTCLGADMGEHFVKHGDAVKDVAFAVEDCRRIFEAAKARGAEVVSEPEEVTDDDGTVVMATIKTYGDTLHTFVERGSYSGAFLPGFKAVEEVDPLVTCTPPVALDFIDHCVGNMPPDGMIPAVEWYEKKLQFHRFWSVDDSQIHTEYSSLRSVVMADPSERVKMPINEPAEGKRKSQIQEYVDYYGGPGVQHIALNTRNIINAITQLRARGVRFLRVPDSYYELLKVRLEKSGIEVKEDLAELQRLNILVDFDDSGYLLQLFTAPLMDRPTVFLEIIQREGNSGFGAGNFKSLFESIEREQAARGNLV
uniref:4-hydroxyphenylpyruvate dioxygenase n=1 Tax=Bicosoecida sp. CB-2014 TaxID=1486930 RepID=A0A7S1C8I8_9STRA